MSEAHDDLKAVVEGHEGISVIRGGGDKNRQWNGIHYKTGLSAKNVNARELSMNIATIPPGGIAGAHIHVDFEVMLYILQGHVRHAYGEGLKQVIDNEAGDFIFINRVCRMRSIMSAIRKKSLLLLPVPARQNGTKSSLMIKMPKDNKHKKRTQIAVSFLAS